MSYNVIAVDVRHKVGLEGTAGGTITPGFLIEKSAGNWIAHSVAGGNCDYVADFIPEESIDDAYASTEWMRILKVAPGDAFYAYLTTSQTITVGEAVTSNGDGYVKSASNGAGTLGGSSNYITFTPVGNKQVMIRFIDPNANSAGLSVTIDGYVINVNLATDGTGNITSTPALIEAAIQAESGYDDLVSTADTGTGAVEAGTLIVKADEVVGYAEEAVTTTSAAKRLLVRKGE